MVLGALRSLDTRQHAQVYIKTQESSVMSCHSMSVLAHNILHVSHMSQREIDTQPVGRYVLHTPNQVSSHMQSQAADIKEQTVFLLSRHEYGEPELTLELVDSMEEAISHLHAHGSGHTECIVTGTDRITDTTYPP